MEQSIGLKALTQSSFNNLPSSISQTFQTLTSQIGMVTIKLLCSYSGRIVPRYPDGKLRYLGGETRVLSVDRSISFSELLLKLGELCGSPVSSMRCQLPTEDLDALVSITSDEDLANLIEEYDRASSLKIRAFLSPPKSSRKISPTHSQSSSSSSTTTSPYATTRSTPRFSNPSAGKPPNHHHQNQSHGYYGYGNSKSSRTYLVHNGNHWQ